MTTDSRHVRVLELHAVDRAGAERSGRLVAEALRTTSFPGDGLPGRLLIRSLVCELGPDAGSGGALARSLSEALARAWSSAVVLHSPEAAQASALHVRAPADIYIELARRALQPAPFDLSAWFWPLLLGPQRMAACTGRDSALGVALTALLEARDGPPALATLLDQALADGSAERLLGSLPAAYGAALLREAGLRAEPEAASSMPLATRFSTDTHMELEPELHALAAAFTRSWGGSDARSLWLCFALLWRARPASTAVPGLDARVRRMLRALSLPQLPLPAARTEPASKAAHTVQVDPAAAAAASSATSQPLAAVPSAYAGLLFVWPILQRLELPTFMRAHPELAELDLARRVLARLAERLEVSADDPIRLAFSPLAPAHSVHAFTLPESWWPDATQAQLVVQPLAAAGAGWVALNHDALPVALWHGTLPERVGAHASTRNSPLPYPAPDGLCVLLDAWERGLARWLERNTELDLRALVQRAARVAVTRTHIDILFDLNAADIRVRTAALDLNPGYVPHLGRVITFHYLAAERFR